MLEIFLVLNGFSMSLSPLGSVQDSWSIREIAVSVVTRLLYLCAAGKSVMMLKQPSPSEETHL